MKFYEVHDPYYALIKAENEMMAKVEYIASVAQDEGTLRNEIKEVDRDYAVAMYSRTLSEDGKVIPVKEIVEDIKNDRNMVLIVDGALA